MKKLSLLLLVELLLTIFSCDLFVYQCETPHCYTTYFVDDGCIFTSGTNIVEESYYERKKSDSDRTDFFVIYQEDIVKDTVINHEWGAERYLEFAVNKTNTAERELDVAGLCIEKNIGLIKILKNIKLHKVDSIIVEIFWYGH